MKSKLKIIIPIVIAVIAIIIAAVFINFSPKETVDFASLMSTAQKYLVEQNYEQAVAEFKKIIDLDPMNADAYLGIAEAYAGMGDTDSAVEWLTNGFEATGDQRLKNMIDELLTGGNAEAGISETSANIETTSISEEATITDETTEDETEKIREEVKEILYQFAMPYYDESKANSTIITHQYQKSSWGDLVHVHKRIYDDKGKTVLQINVGGWPYLDHMWSSEIDVNNEDYGLMCDTNSKAALKSYSYDEGANATEQYFESAVLDSVNMENTYIFKHPYMNLQWHIYTENDKVTEITTEFYGTTHVYSFSSEENTWICVNDWGDTVYPLQYGFPDGFDEPVLEIPSDIDSYILFDNIEDWNNYRGIS